VLYRAVTGPVFPAVRLLIWTLQVRSLWQHRSIAAAVMYLVNAAGVESALTDGVSDGRQAVEDWLRCRTLPRAACCTLVTALSSAFFEVPNSNHVQPLPSACLALTHCSGVKGVRPLLVTLSTASVRPARSSGDTRAAGDD
jgi:hypothetical protein